MSTKIFGGYRLPAAVGIPALSRDLSERALLVRRELALTAVGVVALLLVSDAPGILPLDGEAGEARLASVADGLSFGTVKVEDLAVTRRGTGRALSPLLQACELVDAIQGKLSAPYARRVPAGMDLQLGISFMSDPGDAAWTYAILHTDRDPYRELWEQTPGVEAWPYWNNSDQPDDVTDTEWDTRRDTWQRVLGNSSPAAVGITWRLQQSDLLWQARTQQRGGPGSWLTARAAAEAASRLVEADRAPLDIDATAARFAAAPPAGIEAAGKDPA